MLETMYDANGIGLAATQVNVHERLIVIDVSEERNQTLVLINPEITWASPKSRSMKKAACRCLAFTTVSSAHLRHQGQALDADGQTRTIEADGLLAVCIQHEMDHLMGKVFVEYLSPLKRNRIKTKMLKDDGAKPRGLGASAQGGRTRRPGRRFRGALVSACCAALVGCGPGIGFVSRCGYFRADVMLAWVPPRAALALPAGGERLQYSQQPMGQYADDGGLWTARGAWCRLGRC
jgi:peptide deformylase